MQCFDSIPLFTSTACAYIRGLEYLFHLIVRYLYMRRLNDLMQALERPNLIFRNTGMYAITRSDIVSLAGLLVESSSDRVGSRALLRGNVI